MVDRVVANEDDAYELIKAALDGHLPQDVSITFSDWPCLHIRLTGDRFKQSLTPTVMQGLVDLQTAIYRSYAIARYNVADARKLSKEEREELEFVVKVENGSSILNIDLQKLLEHLCDQVATKMTQESIVIVVLGLGVLVAGTAAYKAYLRYRKDVRLGEIQSQERVAQLDQVQNLSAEETKRMQIMASAISAYPKLDNISRQTHDAKTDLLKRLSDADTIEFGFGETIDGDVAHELTRNARRQAMKTRLDGVYRITRVDSGDPLLFRVKVRRIEDGLTFDADVQDEFVNPTNKQILQRAEWGRRPVKLKIEAKMFDDEIRGAVITGVEVVPE